MQPFFDDDGIVRRGGWDCQHLLCGACELAVFLVRQHIPQRYCFNCFGTGISGLFKENFFFFDQFTNFPVRNRMSWPSYPWRIGIRGCRGFFAFKLRGLLQIIGGYGFDVSISCITMH